MIRALAHFDFEVRAFHGSRNGTDPDIDPESADNRSMEQESLNSKPNRSKSSYPPKEKKYSVATAPHLHRINVWRNCHHEELLQDVMFDSCMSTLATRILSRLWSSHPISVQDLCLVGKAATGASGLLFTHLLFRECLAFFAHLVSSYTFSSVVDIDTKVLELPSP